MNTIKKPSRSIDRKWRKRRHQTASSLILALNNLNSDFRQVAENTLTVRKTLHSAKSKLRDAIIQVQKLQAEVNEKKTRCKERTMELQDSINEVKTPGLYEYNEKEKMTLYFTAWFAETEALNVNKMIQRTERELTANKEIIRNKKTLEPKNDRTIIGPMKIPNIDEMGVIANKTGSINVDRSVKCCICLKNAVNCILYQCGHMCCCFTCVTELVKNSKIKKCPVCRTDIKKVVKTYVA